jgi:signal transduction histidine kinase
MTASDDTNTHSEAFSEDQNADLSFVLDCLDTMSLGLSVARLVDDELNIVLCNQRYIEILEFPEELAVMPCPFEAYIRYNAERGDYGPGDPEEQTQARVELAKQFKPHQFRRTRPNGQVIEVTGKPLSSGDGFVTTYIDVTSQVRAEDYNEILLTALENAVTGIVIYGPDDRLVFANTQMKKTNQELTDSYEPGIKFEDRMRLLISSGAIRGIAGHEEEWLEERMRRRERQRGPFEIQRKDGGWLLINDIVLETGHVVSLSADITEIKSTEEALRRAKEDAELANRTKTEFLANMSHELRTPLNSVIGFSELLISTSFDQLGMDRVTEYLGDINRSGRHLLRLISDILDISKIEVGEMALDEEIVSLQKIVEECIKMMDERARRASTSLTIVSDCPPVWLMADETRLKQILLNLLTNAIKFTESGGDVSVGWCLKEDGSLNLCVTDTGEGMHPESIEIALEPFGQVATSLTRDHEGAGLGLPLSRRLAELHNASLSIQSTLGEGTTVGILFPADRVIEKSAVS